MTTLFFFTAVLLLPAAHSFAVNNSPPTEKETDFIHKCCNSTEQPRACEVSLLPYAGFIQENEGRLVRVAIAVSLSRTRLHLSYFSRLYERAHLSVRPLDPFTQAMLTCIDVFGDAVDSLRKSLNQALHLWTATGQELEFKIADVKTWLSAVLTDADTCPDALSDISTWPIVVDILDRVKRVEVLMDNALALFDTYADHLQTQKPSN